MKVSEFNYELPERLIAQVPIEKRDESRLMVLDREKQTIENKTFKDIIDYLGDVYIYTGLDANYVENACGAEIQEAISFLAFCNRKA